jgi:NAD(P)H dehydrogenase (quinone)
VFAFLATALLTIPPARLPETLPQEVLTKMHAPPKDGSIPVLNDPLKLKEYDGFLFGIPTRYGNFPAQWKVKFDDNSTAKINH